MARRSESGKYIISAGEVGAYTVCPEAWRLKMIAKVSAMHSENIHKGQKLHTEWVKSYDEAIYLARSVKLLLLLIALAILAYIIS